MALHTHIDQRPVLEQALVLAKAGRVMSSQPFQRRRQGRWFFEDMQQREGVVGAIFELDRGESFSHIDNLPGQTIREAQEAPGRIWINHLKNWVTLWAATYTQEPTRTFFRKGKRLQDDDPIVHDIQERYRQAQVDEVMRETDRDLRLGGNVVLRPWFDQDHDELVIHRYVSQCIRVVENLNNPRRPPATVLLGCRLDRDSFGSATRIDLAEIWTEDGLTRLVDGAVVNQEELATKIVPLVHAFDKQPDNTTGYFVQGPGLELASLTATLNNDYYSQMGNVLLLQGHGVAMSFGAGESNLTLGPGRYVAFSGDPDVRQGIEYASPSAPLDDWREIITYLVDIIRETHGIPKSMLSVDFAASGAAIVQANAPLAEMRTQRMKTLRRVENELLRATVAVLEAHDGTFPSGTDPREFSVTVNFGRPSITQSTPDRIAFDNHLIQHGVITPAEILMREKPDEFDTVEGADEFMAERAMKEITTAKDAAIEAGVQVEAAKPTAQATPTAAEPEAEAEPGPELTEDANNQPTLEVEGQIVEATEIQKIALNGAQITALQGIVTAVAEGELPFETALELILAGFPQIPRETALRMLTPARDFEGKAEPEDELMSGHDDDRRIVTPGNPWRVEKRGAKYVVIKTSTNEVVGTHDSKAEADAQQRALEASEPKER